MAWGNTVRLEGAGICPFCHQEKAGTISGPVGGAGFGNEKRQGTIAACINPDCSLGQLNLAELRKGN